MSRIRKAKAEDKNRLKEMYMDIFDDMPAFVDYYFENRIDYERILVTEDTDGRIVAMLSRNEKFLSYNGKKIRADYIYAVAVEADQRGKGIAKALVNEALRLAEEEEPKSDIVYLIPVNEKIYRGNGFVTVRDEDWEEFELNPETICADGTEFFSITSCDEDLSVKLSDFAKEFEKQHYRENYLCTYRDERYFKRMAEQMKAEAGYIALIKKDDKILGFAFVNGESNTCIEDYMCEESYKTCLFSTIADRGNAGCLKMKRHRLMVKIINQEIFGTKNWNETEKPVAISNIYINEEV